MKMSKYIYQEQSTFAYRKLIQILETQPISFFIDYTAEKIIEDELGIYDIRIIPILCCLSNFLLDDITNEFVKVTLSVTNNGELPISKTTLKDCIEYITSYYLTYKYKEDKFYEHFEDKLATIVEDFPKLTEIKESNENNLFERLINLIYAIYQHDPSISSTLFYDSGLGITISKGQRFNEILKEGAFIENLKTMANSFNRNLYDIHGDYLLSFNRQLEIVREYIRKRFNEYDTDDVVVPTQKNEVFRWSHIGKKDITNDERIRLLDCMFYLEYKGEIILKDILPARLIIDATNLKTDRTSEIDEINLNSILKLVPNGKNIEVVIKETGECIYQFVNKDNQRLVLFKAIAEKYPNPISRNELANILKLEKGKLLTGEFYKTYIYSPIQTLSGLLKLKTKNRVTIDTSRASSIGYLLRINL